MTTFVDLTDGSIPPRRLRGRPPAFEPETEALYRNTFPEITTRRGRQNQIYAGIAINALTKAGGHAQFEWLLGPSREAVKLRVMVLAELGRMHDRDAIPAFAEVLCREKYSARMAIALIRQRVRKAAEPRPDVVATTRYLVGAVAAWFERYPDADDAVMLDALSETYSDEKMGQAVTVRYDPAPSPCTVIGSPACTVRRS